VSELALSEAESRQAYQALKSLATHKTDRNVSPLPTGKAEFINLQGRATDHYPMLKNSVDAKCA
jgi:hypothetical protein